MAKTLEQFLNEDLSPDKVKNMTVNELTKIIVDNKIVLSEADVCMLIVEGLQRACKDDDEFPIHYYDKTEPMSEEGKVINNPGEMLTDNLVESMKQH